MIPRQPVSRTNGARQWRAVFLCLLIGLSVLISQPCSSAEEEAILKDILVTSKADALVVYGRVARCFTQDMEAAIMAGVPTTFTFLFHLYQTRSLWFDRKVAAVEIRHTIKYDIVKKTFYVSTSTDKEPAAFQDLEGAKRAMSEFNTTIPLPKEGMRRELIHYLNMKAKLDKVRLPLGMEYVFFFVSLWDFETAWFRQPVSF